MKNKRMTAFIVRIALLIGAAHVSANDTFADHKHNLDDPIEYEYV